MKGITKALLVTVIGLNVLVGYNTAKAMTQEVLQAQRERELVIIDAQIEQIQNEINALRTICDDVPWFKKQFNMSCLQITGKEIIKAGLMQYKAALLSPGFAVFLQPSVEE